jgi:hypothetical protein
MAEILPPEKEDKQDGGSRGGNHFLIGHLHYHANDISELRKLAEVDPTLAEKVIDQRDKENERIVGSYNLGLITSGVLVCAVLIAVTCLIIFAGVIATFASVGVILACALFIRVLLTGEWSETSWLGKILNVVLKALGGTSKD